MSFLRDLIPSRAESEISRQARKTYDKTEQRFSGSNWTREAFVRLALKLFNESKTMTPDERQQKFEYAQGRDPPEQPIDNPGWDACAKHLAWSVVYFYWLSESGE